MAAPPPPSTEQPSNPEEDKGPEILGTTLAVTILALLTVCTRLYVRLGIVRNFGWDDAFMLLALTISISGQGVVIGEVQHGGGQHVGDVDPVTYQQGVKLSFILQPVYVIALCVVKLAIGASLLRIAVKKVYRYCILGIMAVVTFYSLGYFFTLLFQCPDLSVLWAPTLEPENDCWSGPILQYLAFTNAALNIVTDLLFAVVIPLPLIWPLHMSRRTRISLLLVLSLGLLACVAAIVRLPYLLSYGKGGPRDMLWDQAGVTIWTIVEVNVGIVAGSLPALAPLMRGWLGGIGGSYASGDQGRKDRRGTWASGATGSGAKSRRVSHRNFTGGSRRSEAAADGDGRMRFGFGRDRTADKSWHTVSSRTRDCGDGISERALNEAGERSSVDEIEVSDGGGYEMVTRRQRGSGRDEQYEMDHSRPTGERSATKISNIDKGLGVGNQESKEGGLAMMNSRTEDGHGPPFAALKYHQQQRRHQRYLED